MPVFTMLNTMSILTINVEDCNIDGEWQVISLKFLVSPLYIKIYIIPLVFFFIIWIEDLEFKYFIEANVFIGPNSTIHHEHVDIYLFPSSSLMFYGQVFIRFHQLP